MVYVYAQKTSYEDYASGRVIYHHTGRPNYPVRLASELFQRAYAYCSKDLVTLYDPCCGGAYLLTVLGLMHGHNIGKIQASDVDEKAIDLSQSNLDLLTIEGLETRMRALEMLHKQYGRKSHIEAMASVETFKKRVHGLGRSIVREVAVMDLFHLAKGPVFSDAPDIIMADVPYGHLAAWGQVSNNVTDMMTALMTICHQETIIVLSMNKSQKLDSSVYSYYKRLEKLIVGKRRIEILSPLGD